MKTVKTEIVMVVQHDKNYLITKLKNRIKNTLTSLNVANNTLIKPVKKVTFRFNKRIVSQEDAHAILDALHECYELIEQNTAGIAMDEKDTARMWLHKYGRKY